MKQMRSMAGRKILIIVILVIFGSFSLSALSFGQMEAAPAGTSGADIVKQDIKQPLPKPGNVTVNFKDVDIKTVLHYLSEVSNVDIVPSPGVEAKVTMRLRDKPWLTALDIVTRNYGYTYSREGDIIRVIPRGQLQTEEPVTEVIPLNNIIREIELEKEEEGDEITVRKKDESIQQLMSAISYIIDTGRGERATYISSVNSVIVTAIPAHISQIKDMVAEIDKRTPQIILDTKIVEILLDEDERFGVDWQTIISAAGARRPITFPFTGAGLLTWLPSGLQRQFFPSYNLEVDTVEGQRFPYLNPVPFMDPTAVPAGQGNSIFSFGTLDFTTFQATLSLLEQRGDTEILSSPRITTLNNQKATIKVIEKIMLQQSIESTESARTVTIEYESEDDAREVGVKMMVIPHVNEEGDISVNLLPEVSNNEGFSVMTIAGQAQQGTTALTFSSREANTIIRVKDGETIYLGGLIRKRLVKTDNRFPILGDLLGDIPVLGNAFKYEAQQLERTEVVFFVTVYLVKDGMDSIRKSQTVPEYNKFFTEQEKKFNPSSVPVMRTGKMKVTEEQVEVPVSDTASVKKKGYKPFLDFRKQKKREENRT
ncbi:MAG: secretin and TonB N-terminal domain-containing protein [Candidatus Omnitrophota bacterium]|nr:secretin and TonB N-terminal domain-containing protein [Candidatus Omnitrophota bacterium]